MNAEGIKHVVTIIFDNTHFQRDPARDGSTLVLSDLEQMPHRSTLSRTMACCFPIITHR